MKKYPQQAFQLIFSGILLTTIEPCFHSLKFLVANHDESSIPNRKSFFCSLTPQPADGDSNLLNSLFFKA
jgi:hypothetical protein